MKTHFVDSSTKKSSKQIRLNEAKTQKIISKQRDLGVALMNLDVALSKLSTLPVDKFKDPARHVSLNLVGAGGKTLKNNGEKKDIMLESGVKTSVLVKQVGKFVESIAQTTMKSPKMKLLVAREFSIKHNPISGQTKIDRNLQGSGMIKKLVTTLVEGTVKQFGLKLGDNSVVTNPNKLKIKLLRGKKGRDNKLQVRYNMGMAIIVAGMEKPVEILVKGKYKLPIPNERLVRYSERAV